MMKIFKKDDKMENNLKLMTKHQKFSENNNWKDNLLQQNDIKF